MAIEDKDQYYIQYSANPDGSQERREINIESIIRENASVPRADISALLSGIPGLSWPTKSMFDSLITGLIEQARKDPKIAEWLTDERVAAIISERDSREPTILTRDDLKAIECYKLSDAIADRKAVLVEIEIVRGNPELTEWLEKNESDLLDPNREGGPKSALRKLYDVQGKGMFFDLLQQLRSYEQFLARRAPKSQETKYIIPIDSANKPEKKYLSSINNPGPKGKPLLGDDLLSYREKLPAKGTKIISFDVEPTLEKWHVDNFDPFEPPHIHKNFKDPFGK